MDIELIIKEMETKQPLMFGEFKKIQKEMYEMFAKKQRDYGSGNIMLGGSVDNEEDVSLALKGITIRLNDKINRLVTLLLKSNREPQNESVLDTFKDIAVYSVIAQVVANKKWGK